MFIVFGITTLGLFFGLLFGLIYPEILRAEYIPSLCRTDNSTIIQSYCCHRTCSSCDSTNTPSCDLLIAQTEQINPLLVNVTSGVQCDGGYKCCATVCSTCCSGAKVRVCSPCNCFCVSSVSHLSCQMICDVCYTVKLNVEYSTYQGFTTSTIQQGFGTNINDATAMLTTYSDFNNQYMCFYEYGNPTNVVLDVRFSVWKMAIFAVFGILPLYVYFVFISFHLFRTWKHVIPIIVFVWFGLIPFVIFGSVYWMIRIDSCLYIGITCLCTSCMVSFLLVVKPVEIPTAEVIKVEIPTAEVINPKC